MLATAQVMNFSLWRVHAVIVSVWQYHELHGDETDPYRDSNVNFNSISDNIQLVVEPTSGTE